MLSSSNVPVQSQKGYFKTPVVDAPVVPAKPPYVSVKAALKGKEFVQLPCILVL